MTDEQTKPGVNGKRNLVGCEGMPGQGPFMLMILTLENEVIVDARFQTYGCPAAVACGEFVCGQLDGRSVTAASAMTEADIVAGIGPPPLGREHCPGLAIKALRKAIDSDT